MSHDKFKGKVHLAEKKKCHIKRFVVRKFETLFRKKMKISFLKENVVTFDYKLYNNEIDFLYLMMK